MEFPELDLRCLEEELELPPLLELFAGLTEDRLSLLEWEEPELLPLLLPEDDPDELPLDLLEGLEKLGDVRVEGVL